MGSRGPLVEFLQNILQKLNIYSEEIDGIFGVSTKNAVITFQKQYNLTPDGIVGFRTWNALTPYINGGLGFIVPTNISYSYSILKINIDSLKSLYPFLQIYSSGYSVLGNNIPVIKIGNGSKEVFYSASIHANEWICSTLLMKFLEQYCYAYTHNLNIYGYNARNLYNYCSIYIMPMVNPDGVNLVTGEIDSNSSIYTNTKLIADNYPNIPYPNGWKSNIRGKSLINFHLYFLNYYFFSFITIFIIAITAIIAHAICSANENHAFLGKRPIAINIDAIKLSI